MRNGSRLGWLDAAMIPLAPLFMAATAPLWLGWLAWKWHAQRLETERES